MKTDKSFRVLYVLVFLIACGLLSVLANENKALLKDSLIQEVQAAGPACVTTPVWMGINWIDPHDTGDCLKNGEVCGTYHNCTYEVDGTGCQYIECLENPAQ